MEFKYDEYIKNGRFEMKNGFDILGSNGSPEQYFFQWETMRDERMSNFIYKTNLKCYFGASIINKFHTLPICCKKQLKDLEDKTIKIYEAINI